MSNDKFPACAGRQIPNSNEDVNSSEAEERLPMEVKKEETSVAGNVLEVFCPYCASGNYVKRGTRQKKQERVQLYLCGDCKRTFTPGAVKGKHYPKATILDAISLYNLGYSLERSCEIVNKMSNDKFPMSNQIQNPKFKVHEHEEEFDIKSLDIDLKLGFRHSDLLRPSTLSNWIKQYQGLCAYARMREFGLKLYKPEEVIVSATLAHRQLYRFRYHRAKTRMIIEEDFKNRNFGALKEFLELVPVECPHEYFQQGLRASEAPIFFSKSEMIVRAKENYATKTAKFVLESVGENKERHDALQRFMLANDSVTVATEVPVYIRREDLTHMGSQLGFQMFKPINKAGNYKIQNPNVKSMPKSKNFDIKALDIDLKLDIRALDLVPYESEELPKLITGHIDILQIRNGSIHILDYKPHAEKERPLEQLTLYALALSRLTGLRVYHFKCAWFDEKDYFEFFPLHLVYKPKKKRREKVATKEGEYRLNENPRRIDKLKPE